MLSQPAAEKSSAAPRVSPSYERVGGGGYTPAMPHLQGGRLAQSIVQSRLPARAFRPEMSEHVLIQPDRDLLLVGAFRSPATVYRLVGNLHRCGTEEAGEVVALHHGPAQI